MDETVLVQEVNPSDCLNEEVKGGLFREAALFLDEDKEVALGDILHDQVDVLIVLQVGIHAHDVHMLEPLMNLNFSSQGLLHLGRLEHSFV